VIKEKLEEIKKTLDKGEKPPEVSVRTLLGWFNAYRRGWWVVREINRMLDNYLIETYPYFDGVYIDSLIQFRKKKPIESEQNSLTTTTTTTTNKPLESLTLISGDEVINYDDPTYRIAKLEAANKDLIFVKPDSELSEAITKMMTYDYSQLPVMQ